MYLHRKQQGGKHLMQFDMMILAIDQNLIEITLVQVEIQIAMQYSFLFFNRLQFRFSREIIINTFCWMCEVV